MKIQDIKIDINSMCEFEDLTGRSLLEIIQGGEALRMTDVRGLVQVGLGLKDKVEAGEKLKEYMADDENEPILDLLAKKIEEAMNTKKKEK